MLQNFLIFYFHIFQKNHKNNFQSFSIQCIHLCSTNSSLAYISVSNYAIIHQNAKSILRRLKMYFIFPLKLIEYFIENWNIEHCNIDVAFGLIFVKNIYCKKKLQDDATFVWNGNSKLIYGKFQIMLRNEFSVDCLINSYQSI